MKVAAFVFLASGLAYLGWDLSLTISQGISIGSLIMAVLAAALLYQAYELFRNKSGARWRAIISSGAISICSGYIAFIFLLPPSSQSFVEFPSEAGPVGAAAIVFIAYAIVVVVLALTKESRPNEALNPKKDQSKAF